MVDPFIAQVGAFAALDDAGYIRCTRENNVRGLQFFADAFQRMKLEFLPSFANFILVRVGDGQRVFEEMQAHGVIVRPMGGYQLPEWIRITVGTLDQNVRCLNVLHNALTD